MGFTASGDDEQDSLIMLPLPGYQESEVVAGGLLLPLHHRGYPYRNPHPVRPPGGRIRKITSARHSAGAFAFSGCVSGGNLLY